MNIDNKKDVQLGMSHGTANARLNRMILFSLVQNLGMDICFRCRKKIEKIAEFSIEHRIAWLNSNNPKELFFDLNNISFSHLKCNSGAGTGGKSNRGAPEFQRSKTHCKNGHEFTIKNTRIYNGHRQCRQCERERPRDPNETLYQREYYRNVRRYKQALVI